MNPRWIIGLVAAVGLGAAGSLLWLRAESPIPSGATASPSPGGDVPFVSGTYAVEAPARPPDAFVFADVQGSISRAGGRQMQYDWTVGERDISLDESEPPIHWPAPLTVRSGSPAGLAIHSADEWPPSFLEVRVWRGIEEDGLPAGQPTVVSCGAQDAPKTCRLAKSKGSVGAGWHTILPLGLEPGDYFVTATASWFVRSGNSVAPRATVSWLFRVEIRD